MKIAVDEQTRADASRWEQMVGSRASCYFTHKSVWSSPVSTLSSAVITRGYHELLHAKAALSSIKSKRTLYPIGKNKHKREPRNANSNAAVPTKEARDKRRIRCRIIIRIALLTVIVRVGWAIGFVLFTKSSSQKPLPMPSCPPTTSTPNGGNGTSSLNTVVLIVSTSGMM